MSAFLSFVDLFNNLEAYIDDPKKRWKQCLRAKRGCTDTSHPGGFYKDQAYLIGASQILENRHEIDFNKLYWGKIALDDLNRPEIDRIVNSENLMLPRFMEDMGAYRFALGVIANTNNID